MYVYSSAVVLLFVEIADKRNFDLYVFIGYEFVVDIIIKNTKMLED